MKDYCKKQDKDCTEWLSRVKTGYGDDYKLYYVPESTPLHWGTFKSNLNPGAITYLPSHFVLQNWDQITSLDVKLAKYKSKDTIEWTKNTNVKNHEWKRSFNIVYSTLNLDKNPKKKELLEFLVTQSQTLSSLHLTPVDYYLKDSKTIQQNKIEIDLTAPDNINS